jgi:hypothetical protein
LKSSVPSDGEVSVATASGVCRAQSRIDVVATMNFIVFVSFGIEAFCELGYCLYAFVILRDVKALAYMQLLELVFAHCKCSQAFDIIDFNIQLKDILIIYIRYMRIIGHKDGTPFLSTVSSINLNRLFCSQSQDQVGGSSEQSTPNKEQVTHLNP